MAPLKNPGGTTASSSRKARVCVHSLSSDESKKKKRKTSVDQSTRTTRGETPPQPPPGTSPKARVRGKPSKNTGIEKLKPKIKTLRVRPDGIGKGTGNGTGKGTGKGRAQGKSSKSISIRFVDITNFKEENISSAVQGRGKSISGNSSPQPFNSEEESISSLKSISPTTEPLSNSVENHTHVLPSIIQENNNNTQLNHKPTLSGELLGDFNDKMNLKEEEDEDSWDEGELFPPCSCCNRSESRTNYMNDDSLFDMMYLV